MITSTFITLATQTHTRSYVSINGLIMLKRSYCVSKSLPLSRTILSFASPADSSNILYNAFFYHTHLNVSESATIQSHGNAKRTSATSKPYYRTLNDVLANTKKLLKQEWKQRLFMIKSMANQVVCTLVHHKGNGWEIQVKCIDKKKKNPWGKNLTMICRMSFVCKVKAANWYARSPSLVKAIKLFLATMSNYKMLNCFVATITVFYQFIQLSIFVTVGSLTLVTTIKGWWILMIIQYSWVQPWSILKRIHRSFVGFY